MHTIAIVGAGRVGTAAAKLFLALTDHNISFIDSSEEALVEAYESCTELYRPEHRVAYSPTIPVETFVASTKEELEATLSMISPELVICSTPFHINILVAEIASKLQTHYIDFTEDHTVSEVIANLDIENCTFVPQTGLAPGLINYLGLSLFDDLGEPASLELRVGALPQVSFAPEHYAITWSPEGLINEYLKPSYRKVDGVVQTLDSLALHERIIVNGIHYEAFSTAGGIGNLEAYDHVPSVQYKTIRYPGHLDFLTGMLSETKDFNEAVQVAKNVFVRTRDDVVVLVAHATDKEGMSASAGLHFFPSEEYGLTALELTTAGVGVAVAELILAGELDSGMLNCAQIPFDKLLQTAALRYVFEHLV